MDSQEDYWLYELAVSKIDSIHPMCSLDDVVVCRNLVARYGIYYGENEKYKRLLGMINNKDSRCFQPDKSTIKTEVILYNLK